MDKIRLSAIEIYAYHGVLPEEKRDGQRFLVDVEMLADLSAAARSDRLEDTVSYAEVCEVVYAAMTEKSYDLIERAAGEVCQRIINRFDMIERVTVTVTKPDVLLCCKHGGASATIESQRN